MKAVTNKHYSSPPLGTELLQALQQAEPPLQRETQLLNNLPESHFLAPNTVSEPPQFPVKFLEKGGLMQASPDSATHNAKGTGSSTTVDEDNLQRLLKAIKDAGYVIKKEENTADPKQPESPGPGREWARATSASRKGENLLCCTVCTNFRGRPSELKYIITTHIMAEHS
jgi:hypothetical protein